MQRRGVQGRGSSGVRGRRAVFRVELAHGRDVAGRATGALSAGVRTTIGRHKSRRATSRHAHVLNEWRLAIPLHFLTAVTLYSERETFIVERRTSLSSALPWEGREVL